MGREIYSIKNKQGRMTPDNFAKNGLQCVVCKKELTGLQKKYCTRQCNYINIKSNYGN